MIEDNFKSMMILECYGDLVEQIQKNKNSYLHLRIKKDNAIYTNFSIEVSDKYELIDITISWEEDSPEKNSILNINTLEERSMLEKQLFETKVCKIKVWRFHPDSKFIFVFFQNTNITKSSVVISNFFGQLTLRTISLSNLFFDSLINYNQGISMIGKTIAIGFNNVLSCPNTEERITELKFVANLTRNINVKINNKGTVKISNKPKYEEAYEIVEIINHALIKVDSFGELYSE